MFNENLPPEELTQVKMGRIVKEKYPDLDEGDQRQYGREQLPL